MLFLFIFTMFHIQIFLISAKNNQRTTSPLPYSWYTGVWLVKLVGWLSCLHPTLIARSLKFQVIQCDQISVDQSSQLKIPAWSIRHDSGSSWLCDDCSSSIGKLLNSTLFQSTELNHFNSMTLPAASVSATCPVAISKLTVRVHEFLILELHGMQASYDNLYIDRAPVHHGRFKPTDVYRLWPWELVERLRLHERTNKSYRVKSNVHYLQHSQPLTWLVMITYIYIM